MLKPRIIPCLLIRNRGLVKTNKFGAHKYVGDPLNTVRIFNEMFVDEIMVIDIDATKENREPDFNLIKNIAAECRMPLCYGGGVKTETHVEKIISLGAEKVAMSSAAIFNPDLIKQSAQKVGNQSIVVVLDVKKKTLTGGYQVMTHNGKKKTGYEPEKLARKLENLGAGEIVVYSIDRDGTMGGYDLELVHKMRKSITVPMTVIGGAGSLVDIKTLIDSFGVIGAGAGSMFVFKGKYRAVLVSYPSIDEKIKMFNKVNT